MGGTDVSKSYEVNSVEEQHAFYEAWAQDYEKDLCAMGYRIPAMIASVFVRYVPIGTTPLLDAGCGGGIQAEPLVALGYNDITGIDLSEGMLAVAKEKGLYEELRAMTLGEHLDFPDDHFAAILSSGTITPKHAPPHSFEELIRIAQPGAPIIFSMRADAEQDPAYPAALERLEQEGRWKAEFATDGFHSMPYGEPEVIHRIHVYRVM